MLLSPFGIGGASFEAFCASSIEPGCSHVRPPSFERWMRAAERDDPSLCRLTIRDIVTDLPSETALQRFPDATDIAGRETELLPAYQPLGEIFCDLHDRPERMLAKGVIRDIVSWKSCRTYFYWRLKRRVEEIRLVDELVAGGKAATDEAAAKAVAAKVAAATGDEAAYKSLKGLSAKDL